MEVGAFFGNVILMALGTFFQILMNVKQRHITAVGERHALTIKDLFIVLVLLDFLVMVSVAQVGKYTIF